MNRVKGLNNLDYSTQPWSLVNQIQYDPKGEEKFSSSMDNAKLLYTNSARKHKIRSKQVNEIILTSDKKIQQAISY